MRKIIALPIAAAIVCFSGASMAKEHRGGFVEKKMQPMSVEEVMMLSDDTRVMMDGKIENRVEDDKYIFNDGKNTIVVEIENKAWQGQTVSPEDSVSIWGKVDKDNKKTEVEVKKIEVKKPQPK